VDLESLLVSLYVLVDD
jgi:hypothetical protein